MVVRSVGVVGGGIVGLAIARQLSLALPGVAVTVLEKEREVATHQTGHNSGVVHAGLYYRPGSLKAELCSRGRLLLRAYCLARGLPYEECGKLVVAVRAAELAGLDALEAGARRNGVPDLRRLDARGITDVEPHVTGLSALHSPRTAVTDFGAVARAMADDITRAGGEVLASSEATAVRRTGAGVEVRTAQGPLRFDRLVIAAGLQVDRVAGPVDAGEGPRVVPFKGEYLSVVEAKRDLVRGLVYPFPDPRYPFLGVHFTRRVSGELEIGPNAVLALDREGYGRAGVRWPDVRDTLAWPGFWRMARTHWRTGVREVRGSLSLQAYLSDARRYVPEIAVADVVRGRRGVRAQAVDRDGSLVDDFRIHESDGITSIRNAPSPAATSSLAIAEYVVERLS